MKLEQLSKFMSNAEFIRRLQAAGMARRANMLHTNMTAEASRLEGDLARMGALMSPVQRARLAQQVAALRQKAANIDRGSDPGGSYAGPLIKKRHAKKR